MLVSLLFGIGIFSVSSSSFVSASPLIEIGNGQKCGKLNLIRDDGVFSYRCVKQGKSKVWKKIGAAPSATTTIPIKIATVPQPFGDGVFRVGIDIAPGRYLSGGKTCGYEVVTKIPSEYQPKFSGSSRSILDVRSTDVSVISRGCNVWQPMLTYTPTRGPGDGDWVVGLEFPAGVYQSAERNCIWMRMSGFRSPNGPTQLNTNLFDLRSSYTYVRVLPTDVGLYSTNCGVWTRYNE